MIGLTRRGAFGDCGCGLVGVGGFEDCKSPGFDNAACELAMARLGASSGSLSGAETRGDSVGDCGCRVVGVDGGLGFDGFNTEILGLSCILLSRFLIPVAVKWPLSIHFHRSQ